MQKNDPNQKRYLGQVNETKVLKIIRALKTSKTHSATQAEIVARTELEIHVVRQILRRLRRHKKVKVTFLSSLGNRKVRVYS